VQLDSLVVRNVTTGEFAGLDWLPGTDSLVVAGRATLKVLSSVSGSGSIIAVTVAHSVSVSQDGNAIVYTCQTGRGVRLCEYVLATGQIRQITTY